MNKPKFKLGQTVYVLDNKTMHRSRKCPICEGCKKFTIKETGKQVLCPECCGTGKIKYGIYGSVVNKGRIHGLVARYKLRRKTATFTYGLSSNEYNGYKEEWLYATKAQAQAAADKLTKERERNVLKQEKARDR